LEFPIFSNSRGEAAPSLEGIVGYKLKLAYLGTGFCGWQRQRGRRTVQGELEEALCRIWKSPVKAAAAGRTDAGVHALGQVVSFRAFPKLSPDRLTLALNDHLAPDLRVLETEVVEPDFHARFDCVAKTYQYRIWNAPVSDPFQWMRAWHIPVPLDVQGMREAARAVPGTHDFASFASSSGRPVASTRRTVYSLEIETQGPWIFLWIEADGFLYHMARNIVGALVRVGKGKLSASTLSLLLEEPRRSGLFGAAPPWGLYFYRATYPCLEERIRKKKEACRNA
jgi:tRNA pseudouridine38-40 synthase